MSNIPLARAIISDIVKHPPSKWLSTRTVKRRLNMALGFLRRRKCVYRTERGHRTRMTPALALRIKRWADNHPSWDNQDIAERFNVTNARVSEVLNGKNK